MLSIRTKLTTLFTAAVMIMTMPVAAFGGRVFAEDGVKEGTYRVEGFNQEGIITDPDGNTLDGVVAFCLDTKLHPPVASVDYTGKSLSELTDYDTTVEITNLDHVTESKHITANVRRRLLAFLKDQDAILAKYNDIDLAAEKQWFLNNAANLDYYDDPFGFRISVHEFKADILPVTDENKAVPENYYAKVYTPKTAYEKLNDGLLRETEDELKALIGDKFDAVWNSWSPTKTMLRQQLVRMIIHDDALWGGLLADDGKLYNDNKPDEYFTQTRKYYLSADPMSDPHSLWNVLYKPMIDYIDTLPDYFEEGLDALILVPGDNSYQTMLGAWFEAPSEEVRIMKVDMATGRSLQGAELEVLDADGKGVDSWTSSDEAHTVGGLSGNITYTIREITAPEGYTAAEDITFTVGAGGTVNTEANVTEDGVILVENTLAETPEPEPVQPVTVVHAPIAGVPRQPGGTAPVLVQPVTGEDVSAGAGLEDSGEELPEEETAPSVIVLAVVIAAAVLTGKKASVH